MNNLEQARADAKYYMPMFAGKTPFQVIDLINSLSQLWCEHSNALKDGNVTEVDI